tara:strand:+ start:1357 stop:1707 length:351 start_codon:yes stop_codon:yes gene_type:complete
MEVDKIDDSSASVTEADVPMQDADNAAEGGSTCTAQPAGISCVEELKEMPLEKVLEMQGVDLQEAQSTLHPSAWKMLNRSARGLNRSLHKKCLIEITYCWMYCQYGSHSYDLFFCN